jgi:hypothetical protein
MTLNRVLGAAAFAAVYGVFGIANATTVTSGDISVVLGTPQPAEPQIFLDAATDTSTTGHVGSQSGNPGTPAISFVTDITSDFANGYSTISGSAQHSLIGSLTVSVPTGWFFTDLEFATLKGNQVTVTGMDGATTVGTYSNDSLGTGLINWLTLAINGKEFTSLIITSSDGFEQLKEFNISGLEQVCPEGVICNHQSAVPLPAAIWLMGSILGGGAGAGAWRRRKRRAKTA